jgi:phage/plasmid-associated DNA primase
MPASTANSMSEGRELTEAEVVKLTQSIKGAAENVAGNAYGVWADKIMDAFDAINRPLAFWRGEFRCYSNGCYRPLSALEIQDVLLKVNPALTISRVTTALGVRAFRTEDYFNPAGGLTCADGTLILDRDRKTDRIRFEDHSPGHRSTEEIPISFLRAGGEDEMRAFLRGAIGDDIAIRRVLELVGLAIFGEGCLLQRILLFQGDGLNGKGTLLSLMSSIFPASRRSAVTGDELLNDYGRASLNGSRVNMLGELDRYSPDQLTMLKTLVSGEPISARYVRQSGFTLTPRALHVSATNQMPRMGERTAALLRRFVVVRFTKSARLEEQDADYQRDLIRRCGPAFLRMCVEAASDVLARLDAKEPNFPMSPAMIESREALFGESPIRQFARQHLVRCRGEVLRIADVRTAYEVFCFEQGMAPLGPPAFKMALEEIGYPATKRSVVYLTDVAWAGGVGASMPLSEKHQTPPDPEPPSLTSLTSQKA